MSRSCPYRLEVSDACSWHQDEALNSSIYILLNTGPTGFLLKEENETKNFKVFISRLVGFKLFSFDKLSLSEGLSWRFAYVHLSRFQKRKRSVQAHLLAFVKEIPCAKNPSM
jgi:hypothetical protein